MTGNVGHGEAQAKGAGRAKAKAAGLAAGIAVFAVTFALLQPAAPPEPSALEATLPQHKTAQPPQSTAQPPVQFAVAADETSRACQQPPRRYYVTGTPGATVRFRTANYTSPLIVLGADQQTVTFPMARPAVDVAEEEIIVEGNAPNLLLTSDVVGYRRDIAQLAGRFQFTARWAPMKTC